METGSRDERQYLANVANISMDVSGIRRALEAANARMEALRPTEGQKRPPAGPWEYQLTVWMMAQGAKEAFTYGPYPTEDCAGLLESLRRGGRKTAFDWKLERRPVSDWTDYKSGVN